MAEHMAAFEGVLLEDGFVQLPHAVARSRRLDPYEKVVLIALASMAGGMAGSNGRSERPVVQPSLTYLRGIVGAGKTKVRNAVAGLVEKRLVSVRQQWDGRGKQRANRYIIREAGLVEFIIEERRLERAYRRQAAALNAPAPAPEQLALEGDEGSASRTPTGETGGPPDGRVREAEGEGPRDGPKEEDLQEVGDRSGSRTHSDSDPEAGDLSPSGVRDTEGSATRTPARDLEVQLEVFEVLRGRLSRANFETWVADVVFEEIAPGEWELSCRSAFVHEWLSKRAGALLRVSLETVLEDLGRPPLARMDLVIDASLEDVD